MALGTSTSGVSIVITGNASQAIQELGRLEQSLNALLTFEVGSKLEASFGAMFSTIAGVLQRVAGTVSSIAKSALAVGGGFEAQMTSVKVISGATEEELEQLTQKAREMGATLPISAKDAATAMTLLAQRGTNVKDILASVADVANLSISQGVSMGAAADLLGSTLTNFGLNIEDAAKVTAIFNNASNQSALNMSKLTEALKYVGPTAGSIGMNLTEAISAMEALANAGLTGEMTGTGLAMVLTKIASKSRIMGVETKNLDGTMRPLADIFSDLKAKGFSLAEATKEFGARGRLAALNLAKQADSLKTNEERLKQWGSTAAAVNERAKTFTNTMAAFRSAVEELHIEIFEQIKNQSKDALAGITALVRTFSEWVGQTKIAEKSLNAFLEGIGFNIPAGTDFKKLLDSLDVQAVVDRVKSLGTTIRDIADNIASFAKKVQPALSFLIEHLDTFATISFWGGITGKALQIPATLFAIASGFNHLYSVLKALTALNFAGLIGFLKNPIFLATGVVAGGLYLTKKFADAEAELEKAEQAEKKFLKQQAQADSTLELDIKLNVKTGFEKLPESWTKASDELRAKVNETVKALQENFKDKVGKAIDEVAKKFPDMAEALGKVAGKLDTSTLIQITKALQGNKEAYDSLPPHMQKVTEKLYEMGVQAGQTKGNLGQILETYKFLQQFETSPSKKPQKSELAVFGEELSTSLNSLLEKMPDNIERLQKFMGGNSLHLAVDLSLENAQEQIKQLAKSLGEKFNIPADAVNSVIFSRLQTLGAQGSAVAQSLTANWKGAGSSIDTFLQYAQDAITYLDASPEKFTPALNSLMAGIQKIDPVTGKITEQFKKAYNALKQWTNANFDKLSSRIQKLRKAIAGGFLDSSALEAEASRALQQIKVKVVTELAPMRDSFASEGAYLATVASEVQSIAEEMGGPVFSQALRREIESSYLPYGETMGERIGRAFVAQVGNIATPSVTSSVQPSINIDTQPITTAINPLITRLEGLTSQQVTSGGNLVSQFSPLASALQNLKAGIDKSNSLLGRANDSVATLTNSINNFKPAGNNDYVPDFSAVIKEIQNVSAGLVAVQNTAQANISAVNAVENAIKANQQNVSVSLDATAIVSAVGAGMNPFLASLNSNAGAVDSLRGTIDALRSAAVDNTSALNRQQDYVQAGINSLDNLRESVSSLDISQGLTPLLSKLENTGAVYQSSSDSLYRTVQVLNASLDTLKKSADSNTNALDNLKTSLTSAGNSSGTTESFNSALIPLVNAVQNLAVILTSSQNIQQNNSAAIFDIHNAVVSVESAIKSINAGNNYDIDINQQGFIVEKKTDADLVARSTVSALRSGLGNGGV